MLLPSNAWDINLWAVLAAGIAHMLTGLVWYLPSLFGDDWKKLTGKDLRPASQWMFPAFLGHLSIALVLAFLINLAGATTLIGGFAVGVLVWIGFIVTLEVGELVWEKIPFRLFLLRIGNHFIALCLASGILAVWR